MPTTAPASAGIYRGVLDEATRQDEFPAPPPPEPGTPIVALQDIHIGFGPLTVHRGVTLDFERGQTTVLLGPSGTGKSVLLKLIAGLLRPDQGTVRFEGQRLDTLSESELGGIRQRLGFLFQLSALFDSMTVGQNIAFPLVEHTALDPQERQSCVARVLEMVGLPGIEGKMPAELSGGQKKRVALARAIALEPSVVLYDEPTTGLDPIATDVINELINALTRKVGLTSIVVTHDLPSARKIADRLVLLYDGQVICDGDPSRFETSDDPLVRRFMDGRADDRDLARIREAFEHHAAPAPSTLAP